MRGRATHGAKSSKSFHTSKVFLAHSFLNLYELKRSVLLVNEFCIICQKCGDCSAMPLRNVRVRLISSTNRFKYIQTQKMSLLSCTESHSSLSIIITILFVIIIIITRPKPAYGRQGLAVLWGQDTDQAGTFWGVVNFSLRAFGLEP